METAAASGIDGICLAEHSLIWDDESLRDIAADSGITLFSAREIETNLGHVLAVGLKRFEGGMHVFENLRKSAREQGAALVFAHPFRHHTSPPNGQKCLLTNQLGLLDASALEIATAVDQLAAADAIETLNAATGDDDNEFAATVAKLIGAATTGGSDAHSTSGIGSAVTLIDGAAASTAGLAEAIRSGACRASLRNDDRITNS
jgi:hypothetical protein